MNPFILIVMSVVCLEEENLKQIMVNQLVKFKKIPRPERI